MQFSKFHFSHLQEGFLREFFNVKGNENTPWLLKIRLLICYCKLKLFVFKPQLLFQLTRISDRNISFELTQMWRTVVFLFSPPFLQVHGSQGMKVNLLEIAVV